MSENEIIRLFRTILLPLISMSVIVLIRSPAPEDIVFGTEANSLMSGGYGPNQVSSSLGLVIAILPYLRSLVAHYSRRISMIIQF